MPFIRSLLVVFCLIAGVLPAGARDTGPPALDFAPLGVRSLPGGGDAPMDVSFGIYPMSVFGIAQAIHRYDGTHELDDGPIAYAIPAIRDWERHYPRDPWIARMLLAMQRVYEHAHTEEGTRYSLEVARWLASDYPASIFTRSSRRDLARAAAPDDRPVEHDDEHGRRFEHPFPQKTARSQPAQPLPQATLRDSTIPSYAQPLSGT